DGGGTGGSGGMADGSGNSCDLATTLSITTGNSVSVTGDTTGAPSMLNPMDTNCGSNTGPQGLYRFHVPGTGARLLHASTIDPITTADTIVYVQTMCGGGTELGCNDDGGPAVGPSKVDVSVNGGDDVFIIVDTYVSSSNGPQVGPFKLTVSL